MALFFVVSCNRNAVNETADSSSVDAFVPPTPEGLVEVNGEMVVIPIVDRVNEMSADLFRGSFNDALLDSLMPEGSSPSAINVFFVRISNRNREGRDYVMLIDAGLGSEAGGTMLEQLRELDVEPKEVNVICLTHLHADHIGGLVEKGMAVFPNAEIYLSVEEFNAWSDDGPMAARNDQWKKVLACYANHINLFQDGDSLLGGNVVPHLAVGHTPGHTVYEAGSFLFVGDLIHAQDLQINNPDFCARFDNNSSQAIEARKKWIGIARTSQKYFCDAHCYVPFLKL